MAAVYVTGTVPQHVTGVMATFGSVKRGMKRQLTVNGLPAYTYVGDKAGIVKCDGVEGWHAARPKSAARDGASTMPPTGFEPV